MLDLLHHPWTERTVLSEVLCKEDRGNGQSGPQESPREEEERRDVSGILGTMFTLPRVAPLYLRLGSSSPSHQQLRLSDLSLGRPAKNTEARPGSGCDPDLLVERVLNGESASACG